MAKTVNEDAAPATYTVREAAKILGVGRDSVYAAAKAGKIPAIHIGHRIVIPRVPLEAMVGIKTTEAA